MSKRRIAIFQYEWGLQSYSRDLAVSLAAHGYLVDFFIDHTSCRRRLIDSKSFDAPNLLFHVTERPGRWHLLRRAVNKAKRALLKAISKSGALIRKGSVTAAQSVIAKRADEYLAFIGIEKKGLIWAGLIGDRFKVPWLYYSLELHFQGDGSYGDGLAHVFPKEREYHRRARATIIQDGQRAEVLFRLNGKADHDLLYMPVSRPGDAIRTRPKFWHCKFGLPESTKVLLYFGVLCLTSRHLDRLFDVLKRRSPAGSDLAMVFHGWGEPFLPGQDAQAAQVFLSDELVPEGEVPTLVGGADIGLSLYSNDSINDRLTAFSSQKVALYLQCGVPVISYRNESYEQLFSRFRCGEMIDNIEDLPEAVGRILSQHEAYREEAFRAFEAVYSHDRNVKRVLNYFAGMSRDPVEAVG